MAFEFKTAPFDHQREIFEKTRGLEAYALFWEMGCGKTKPIIDTIADLYENDKINAALIVAPNGVHRNWITDELPVHMVDRVMDKTKTMFWTTSKSGNKSHASEFKRLVQHDGLAILTISYQSVMTAKGKRAVWNMLKNRECIYVLDESHYIKGTNTKRTWRIVASGKYAPYRRILTGTPGENPFDLYKPIEFLDPDLWSRHQMSSLAAFRSYFGVWVQLPLPQGSKASHFDKFVEYKNLDKLRGFLSGVSHRVLKNDVLDLPPKLFTKRYFDMTPKQSSMYNQLRDELQLELENGLVIDGSMAIVRLLRLQQITCGYAVADSDEPIEMCDTKNPRLEAAVDFFSGLNHQAIIWARFQHDVTQLVEALGEDAVRYDGQVDDDTCARNKQAFNAGDVQFFVGNPAKGAEGLTLNKAKTTGFYSNSFKLLERLQAEDRNHRIGQDGADHGELGSGVLYADFCAPGTVDEHIIKSLRNKYDIAAQITGDGLKDWI